MLLDINDLHVIVVYCAVRYYIMIYHSTMYSDDMVVCYSVWPDYNVFLYIALYRAMLYCTML